MGTATLLGQAAVGQKYYVAATGNDAGSGTISDPRATIQRPADTAQAGDTVFVRGGTYNALASFPNSGNSAAGYITFESYPVQRTLL